MYRYMCELAVFSEISHTYSLLAQMDGLFVFYLIERNADRLVAANLIKEMCEDLEKKQGPKKKQAPEDDSDKESDQENSAEDNTSDENGEEEQQEQEHESELIVPSTSVNGDVRERSGAGDGREGEGGGDGRDSGEGGGDGGFPGRLRLPIPPGFPNPARLPNPPLPLNIPWLPVPIGFQAEAAQVYESSLQVGKVYLHGYSTGENVGAPDHPELAHVLSEIIGMYNYDSRV